MVLINKTVSCMDICLYKYAIPVELRTIIVKYAVFRDKDPRLLNSDEIAKMTSNFVVNHGDYKVAPDDFEFNLVLHFETYNDVQQVERMLKDYANHLGAFCSKTKIEGRLKFYSSCRLCVVDFVFSRWHGRLYIGKAFYVYDRIGYVYSKRQISFNLTILKDLFSKLDHMFSNLNIPIESLRVNEKEVNSADDVISGSMLIYCC